MDSVFCTMDTVREVAGLDRLEMGNHGEVSREATLFCAATLHRFGLHVDFARLNADTLASGDVLMLQGTPMGLCDPGLASGHKICLAMPPRAMRRGRKVTTS